MSRAEAKIARDRTIELVSKDLAALDLLRRGEDRDFIARVCELAAEDDIRCDLDQVSGLRTFLSWCEPGARLPEELAKVVDGRRADSKQQRYDRRRFVQNLGLDPKSFDRDAFLKDIPTKTVTALPEAYPPIGEGIAETGPIFDKWDPFFRSAKPPDVRKPYPSVHLLQESKLKLDILPHESVILRDSETKELIGVAIRDACPDQRVVAWGDQVVADTTPYRQNIRKEDPGKLVQMGYSAGSRSRAHFDWVRNVTSAKHDASESDIRSSSLFALTWQLMRGRLPPEVIDDFDKFLETTKLKRMDANGRLAEGSGSTGTYTVNIGADQFDFHHVELAPPGGVMGVRYSRASHTEHQPHNFAASWTISRNGGLDCGGHFYLAKYGVRIQAAANTFIVWVPRDAHGTSLQNFHPSEVEPSFIQRGIAFVTSNRLFDVQTGQNQVTVTGLSNVLDQDFHRVEGHGAATIHDIATSYTPRPTSSMAPTAGLTALDLGKARTLGAVQKVRTDVKAFEARGPVLDDRIVLGERVKLQVIGKAYHNKPGIQVVVGAFAEVEGEHVLHFYEHGPAAVHEASWNAGYDIRVDMEAKEEQVTLIYKAAITQSTGEDWGDVSMSLETATPTFGVIVPTPGPCNPPAYIPAPLILGSVPPQAPAASLASNRIRNSQAPSSYYFIQRGLIRSTRGTVAHRTLEVSSKSAPRSKFRGSSASRAMA
ncbi:hypothetical protein FPV67DRAFT_1678612 [Lyophyllum atratum]|nr:hypothetical protein FPV67DRAFT_1678612 [Lyophyllum atratum]